MGGWYAADAAQCDSLAAAYPHKPNCPKEALMRLDLRIAVPAALAVAAVAIPGSSSADPPTTGNCPDGYIMMSAVVMQTKDKNGDGFVCMKTNPSGPVVKDDNCCPNQWVSTNPDDYIDDNF